LRGSADEWAVRCPATVRPRQEPQASSQERQASYPALRELRPVPWAYPPVHRELRPVPSACPPGHQERRRVPSLACQPVHLELRPVPSACQPGHQERRPEPSSACQRAHRGLRREPSACQPGHQERRQPDRYRDHPERLGHRRRVPERRDRPGRHREQPHQPPQGLEAGADSSRRTCPSAGTVRTCSLPLAASPSSRLVP